MYKHLISYLKDDLKTFDREDCKKVKQLIDYLKDIKDIPLKMIREKNYEYYCGYCKGRGVKSMTEWQFNLCRAEMEW